jgi:hypothetical protein
MAATHRRPLSHYCLDQIQNGDQINECSLSSTLDSSLKVGQFEIIEDYVSSFLVFIRPEIGGSSFILKSY